MPIPQSVVIAAPWRSLEGAAESTLHEENFSAELRREVGRGHELFGLTARAIAARQDKDDVLFELEDGKFPLAVVHLTWNKETNPRWPQTIFYRSWEHWVSMDMIPSHADFGDD